jgi:hypothetical protein
MERDPVAPRQGRSELIHRQEGQQVQEVPANLYDDGHELVAVLPLPGLTADERSGLPPSGGARKSAARHAHS